MSACPESLEKFFQQVEEETERRVQDEKFKTVKQADSGEDSAETSLRIKAKARRRGSVSISRFGQLSDHLTQIIDTTPKPLTSPTTPRRVSPSLSPYSTIYQNHSADSLASDNLSDDDANTEDAHHVTQMEQIGGRQSTISRAVGGLLSGRLGRARSASVVQGTPTSNMVIGVSVEEATTEHAPGDDAPGPQTVVHTLRSQRSTNSLTRKESLMDRARGLTKKLRRKSVLMLTPVTPQAPSSSP